MTKLVLFVLTMALVLCIGTVFAEYGQNTTVSTNNPNVSVISTSVTSSTTSTATIASCTVTESLQSEINDLMGKLQDAEKSNDTQMMTELKQKISLLGEEFDKQRESCQAQANAVPTPTTSATGAGNSGTSVTPTNVQPITPTSAQSTTTASTCIDESVATRWKELASQLETAVANNDTEATNQLGSELEALGQEVLNQVIENCSSDTGILSVKLFCPVEAVNYASLEKQKNSLMAQEYQARTAGNTELAIQLQAQIESLNTEATKYSEKCQAKLLASGAAKYFMSTYSQAQVVTTGNAEHAAQKAEKGVIYSNTTAQDATTASVCYIPYELEQKLKDAWDEYYILVKSDPIDMEKMAQVKATISSAEAEINKIKQNCQPTVTCPLISQPAPDFKERCAAKNGTIVKRADNNGCIVSYECSTSAVPVPTSATAPGQAISPGENCTVPVELTQEFEGLWKNYKEAMANNDTEKAASIKQKISEIEQKLSITKGQCVKTIVSQRVNTNDVVNYYKQQVTEIMTGETDTDLQIEQLKSLRGEIDKLITELISKNKRLNASDVSGIVDEIKVKPRMIQAGNSTLATTEAKITTQINKRDVEINPSSTGVIIKEGNITLDSTELTISDNKVSINGTEINIAPSAVALKAKIQNMKTLNLTSENGTPIYGITGDENRKLLWIIPVTIEKQVTIDAVTGDIVKEDRPWWAILTSE